MIVWRWTYRTYGLKHAREALRLGARDYGVGDGGDVTGGGTGDGKTHHMDNQTYDEMLELEPDRSDGLMEWER